MSRDWKPIEHIIANVSNVIEGYQKDCIMEHPQVYVTYEGEKEQPVRSTDFVEKYPYVAFFTNLDKGWTKGVSEWDNLKDNKEFLERLDDLESQLRLITKRMEVMIREDVQKDIDSIFEGIDFPYIKDYIMAEHNFEFDYDSKDSMDLFTKSICEPFKDKELTMEVENDDYEEMGER